MARLVNCVKLGKEAPGLERAPYPGPLGQRIFEHISAEAWAKWLNQQTMLINENRLSPRRAEDRKFLEQAMESYLFNDASVAPEGYQPPSD